MVGEGSNISNFLKKIGGGRGDCQCCQVQTEETKIVCAVFVTSVSFPLLQICFGNFQLLDDGVSVYAMSLRTSRKYRVGRMRGPTP